MSVKKVQTIFDFTRCDQIGNWTECSDAKKYSGLSKAVFVIQKTKHLQRAVLFTLLNSKSDVQNGSCFASVNCEIDLNLSEYNHIIMKCRGQGTNMKYKMLLNHNGIGKDAVVHGQSFTVPHTEFATVKLSLSNFKPYYRAHQLPQDSYNLDTSAITRIGIKIDNGPFLPENRPGVSALEIDWIKAIK